MTEVEKVFPERLRSLREASGLTQEQLGQEIGAGKVPISRYEAGHVLPNIQNLVRIAEALKCSTDYLVGRIDSPALHTASGVSISPVEHALLDSMRKVQLSRTLGLMQIVLEDAEAVLRARSSEPSDPKSAAETRFARNPKLEGIPVQFKVPEE